MARRGPNYQMGGQKQDRPSDEDVVVCASAVDDHLGVVGSAPDQPPSQPLVEPPVILAMTRHEALLIVNLLTLVNSDDARSLAYRLCCKYAQSLMLTI